LCEVECRDDCIVSCHGGTCRVACADPSRCYVECDTKGRKATLCPDGKTLVCGGAACL
jgi:hypothetical protein